MNPDLMDELDFHQEKPSAEELLEFYRRMRHDPLLSREKLQRMIDMTSSIVVARRDGVMVGMARGVTDGVTGRLAECKLDPAYQGPACVTRKDGRIEDDHVGVAREMARRVIERLRELGAERIDAVAYGTEVDFCEEMGFKKVRGWVALELKAGVPVAPPLLAEALH